MYKWYLPTLSEIVALDEQVQDRQARSPAQQRVKAERDWSGAIAALNQLLQQGMLSDSQTLDGSGHLCQNVKGVLLSGPFPVLDQSELVSHLASWTFTVGMPGEVLQLLPAAGDEARSAWSTVPTLPLVPHDPLAAEQFCVVLTAEFSLVLVLGEGLDGNHAFQFSFEPEVVWQVWRSLQARLKLTAPHMLNTLDSLIEQFSPVVPNYRTVVQFNRLMLANLPDLVDWDDRRASTTQVHAGKTNAVDSATNQTEPKPRWAHQSKRHPFQQAGKASVTGKASASERASVTDRAKGDSAAPLNDLAEEFTPIEASSDTELLQAIAHEVRTPLTTIRTLTRLLLKRKDLNPDVIKRLELIDRECTEQIDRFSLIFRAVELETAQAKSSLMSLAPISLAQVIQQNVSRWQQQANQHSHTLDVILPQKLPMVVTDPTMLDQVLTGLIDRITHNLPPGSHIQVRVTPAGHQLKLQLESQPQMSQCVAGEGKVKMGFAPAVRSLGQLLMFQPETGNLSLNMAVTKNLFQALGGKLIVRQKPQEGEVLTIFLPLETKTI